MRDLSIDDSTASEWIVPSERHCMIALGYALDRPRPGA